MVVSNSRTKMGNETAVGASGAEIVRIRSGLNFMLLCPCIVDSHNAQPKLCILLVKCYELV